MKNVRCTSGLPGFKDYLLAGKLFEEVFGSSYLGAMAVGTAVIIVFTLLGGFLAESWTDLAQGLLMEAFLASLLVSLLVERLLPGPDNHRA